MYTTAGKLNGRKCLKCKSAEHARWRDKNEDYMNRSRLGHQMKQRYGVASDPVAYREDLLAEQGGACAICGRTDLTWGKGFNDVWHIDHEHGKEGTHRGILCGTCNLALGKLEPYIDKVVAYLAKYGRRGTEGFSIC
jgi:5-methylcytosine-specific restriction endonuclease McrA